MVWKKERAIASSLLMLASIAESYGGSFIVRDLPERVYVPVTGRDISRLSVKRYVDLIHEWCVESGVDCPLRKEYVRRDGNRFLKVIIDSRAAREVAESLVKSVELRRQRRRDLIEEVNRCRDELRMLRSRNTQLELAVESLKQRLREVREGSQLKEFLRELRILLRDEAKMLKCVTDVRYDNLACATLITVLDAVTEVLSGRNESLSDVFVDRIESSKEYAVRVRKAWRLIDKVIRGGHEEIKNMVKRKKEVYYP